MITCRVSLETMDGWEIQSTYLYCVTIWVVEVNGMGISGGYINFQRSSAVKMIRPKREYEICAFIIRGWKWLKGQSSVKSTPQLTIADLLQHNFFSAIFPCGKILAENSQLVHYFVKCFYWPKLKKIDPVHPVSHSYMYLINVPHHIHTLCERLPATTVN